MNNLKLLGWFNLLKMTQYLQAVSKPWSWHAISATHGLPSKGAVKVLLDSRNILLLHVSGEVDALLLGRRHSKIALYDAMRYHALVLDGETK